MYKCNSLIEKTVNVLYFPNPSFSVRSQGQGSLTLFPITNHSYYGMIQVILTYLKMREDFSAWMGAHDSFIMHTDKSQVLHLRVCIPFLSSKMLFPKALITDLKIPLWHKEVCTEWWVVFLPQKRKLWYGSDAQQHHHSGPNVCTLGWGWWHSPRSQEQAMERWKFYKNETFSPLVDEYLIVLWLHFIYFRAKARMMGLSFFVYAFWFFLLLF